MKALKSRTVQVLILMLVVNLVEVYAKLIPGELLMGLNVILTTLAGYYRVNPKQVYEVSKE